MHVFQSYCIVVNTLDSSCRVAHVDVGPGTAVQHDSTQHGSTAVHIIGVRQYTALQYGSALAVYETSRGTQQCDILAKHAEHAHASAAALL